MALTKVTSAVIKDSTITDSDIGSTLTSAISGSTTALSSSVATRFDSRETDMTLATASIAAITASLGQPVNTDSNVTFGVITSGDINSSGTITATEIHTTFVSSSIAVSSGSNTFGDDTSDSHQFTGSVDVSGSLFVKDGTLTVTDNVDFNGDLDVDGTTNLDVVDIDGAVDMASTLAVSGAATFTANPIIQSDSGTLNFYNAAGAQRAFLQLSGTGLIIDTDSFLEFKPNNSTAMYIDSSGNVGIGTASPGHLLTVAGATDGDNPSIHIIAHGSDSGSIFFGESATNKNGGIEYDNGGQDMYFITNSSRKMKLETEGNLGIGNTVASTINSVNNGGRLVIGDGSGNEGMTIYSGNGSGEYGILYFADGTSGASTYQGWLSYLHDVNALTLATSGTEKVRITSAGTVLIGTNSASSTHDKGLRIVSGEVGSNYADSALSLEGSGGDFYAMNFGVSSAFFGFLAVSSGNPDSLILAHRTSGGTDSIMATFFSNGNTTIGGSLTENSDIRLKENIENIDGALSKVNQMRGITFNRIDTGKKEYGMVADELEEIIPELVDTVDDGDIEKEIPNLKSIKYTKLTSILVEAVKELSAKVEALEKD
jgi:hypothetical protein